MPTSREPERVIEYRFAPLTADAGRTVSGPAIVYGDEAQIGRVRERFEVGGVEVRDDALMTLQHQRGEPLATPTFSDSPEQLRVAAELPAGARQDQALADVRSGLLRGLSVEFVALQERFEDNVRVIVRAVVNGVSVVDSPAYPQSVIEAREAMVSTTPSRPRRRFVL